MPSSGKKELRRENKQTRVKIILKPGLTGYELDRAFAGTIIGAYFFSDPNRMLFTIETSIENARAHQNPAI